VGRWLKLRGDSNEHNEEEIRTNVTWLKYVDGWLASSIIQHYQRINVLWDQGVAAQLAD